MNRSMIARVAATGSFAIVLGAAGGSPSFAQTPDAGHGGHHPGTPAASCAAIASGDGMMSGTADTAMAMGMGMAGTPAAGMPMHQGFDLMFIDMMIPHHESAVAMAEIALERSERPEIRQMAEDIVSSQSAEIGQMKEWRDAWFPGAPAMPMDQMMGSMMDMMGSMGMGAMGGMMGTPGAMDHMGMDGTMGTPAAMQGMDAAAMHGTMDMAAEMERLCAAEGDFDLAFIDAMIPHHESAVLMAQVALERAEHPEMKDLAQAIVDAQETEIGQMREWRQEWFPEAAPSS